MTNDYKDKLLKYLTGNITPGNETNTPYVKTTTSYENNGLLPGIFTTFEVKEALYCRNGNGELTGNILVYGNKTNDNVNWHGFIQILDSEFKELKLFETFSTGTTFGLFEKLNIDEIGQVYGIDYYNNQHRLILLNNVGEKGNLLDYQCILRQSYYLQGDITNTQFVQTPSGTVSGILSVDKSKQSSLYFISGLDGGHDLLYATSFRINVGIANEWINYTDGVVYQGMFIGSYVYFDIDDTISCNYYFQETDSDNKNIITMTYNVGTSLSGYRKIVENLEQYISTITSVSGSIVNANKLYFGITGYSPNGANYDNQLQVYLYDNGNITNVYNKTETLASSYYHSGIKFTQLNNKVFMVGLLSNAMLNNMVVGDVYVNLLGESVDYETKLSDKIYSENITNQFYFGVSNAFNLYNILVSYFPTNDTPDFMTYSTKLICSDGYNGEEYEGKASLYPQQSTLYDSQNNLIFARDLYNHKVYNNYAISTLNVPNTYLNEVEIGNENLISDTNTTLISDNTSITKNVYEDLYINYNNQIKMQNRNETNYISNLGGAIRLNQSCNKLLDYDNAKATKVRITYDDDSSYITSASTSITNNVCTYSIGIHVPSHNKIDKIEILSNDENTIYQTITGLNLKHNKYYIINQDVYIE